MNVKELLRGLEGPGVELNTRYLARFTAENGILVTVSCGRKRGRISLPPPLLGLRPEKWSATSKEFFAGHVNMGQLTLVPKEKEEKLNHLDSRVRYLAQSYSLDDGTYMPLAVYSDFRDEFTEIRSEYMNCIEEVAQSWEVIRGEFIKGVTELVESRGKRVVLKRDREKMLKSIISSIPNATDYRNSAYMTLKVRAFPTTGVTVEGLGPDIEDSVNKTWREDVVANAVKCIETSIGKVFAQACKTAKIYAKTQKMDTRSVNTLLRTATQVKKLNIFANPMLETLGNRLSQLSDKTDEEMEELIEESILDTVEYANATGINLDIKECPFTEAQISDMLALRRQYGAEA